MPNSLTTVRPNGTDAAGSWVASSGTLHGATSDNSDSTYIHSTGVSPFDISTLTLTSPSIPSTATVRSVTLRVRADNAGLGLAHLSVGLFFGGVGSSAPVPCDASSTPTTYTALKATTTPNGSPITPAVANGLKVFFSSTDAGHRVYEAYIDITYNQVPTATVTAPSGTVTTTSNPVVSWTYNDPDNDDQERYRVKVFSAAQYGAGGFDPETSTPTWDSGEVFSSVPTATVIQLPNGTYRAYVKVCDVDSGGRYGPWAYSAFVENAPVVDPPTVTAQLDEALGRIGLTITGTDTDGDHVMIQRSIDGGATWADVPRMWVNPATLWDGALAGLASILVYDYEAPLWGTLRYRTAAIDTITDTTGPWSTPISLLCQDGDTWLKDPLDPTANLLLCDTMNLIDTTSTEPQQVLAALGDPEYDVTGDVAKGETLSLSAAFETRPAWTAFESLRRSRRKLLLQTFDEQWYVRLGSDRSTTLYPPDPITGERLRVVTVAARQVKAP